MSKKLTAKQLLKEVQSIKKQASSGFFKPYPIEYEDEEDLNVSIDSVLLDILDGYGFMGATDVIVKGDTAYVKGNFELELDVKQIKPWWEEADWGFVGAEIISGLSGWSISGTKYDIVQIVGPGSNEEYFVGDLPSIILSPFQDGLVIRVGDLSGDYDKDIKTIQRLMLKDFEDNFEEPPWWKDLGEDMSFVRKLVDDVVSNLPKGWSVDKYDNRVWQVVGPGFGDRNNPTWWNAKQPEAWQFAFPDKQYPGGYVDHGGGNYEDPLWFDDDLTNDYKKDVSIIAKHILKEFKKYAE